MRVGLWILFLIVVHLLLDVQQGRQYVDNLRLLEPASTGEKRKLWLVLHCVGQMSSIYREHFNCSFAACYRVK